MSKPGECSIVTVERQITAVVKAVVPMAEIPDAQRSSRRKIDAALKSLDVGPVGASCTLWRPSADGRLDMEPGVVVSHAFEPVGDVVASALPAGRVARFLLVGPFDGLPGAWQTLFAWCAKEGLKPAGINWEIYGDMSDDPTRQETWVHALLA
ncbi:MAG: GyrI-like domain-containing protein [Rhizobiales bacterium]|nr:GyrI-like domain-containing protein [Hyphomicrobiales bacterium]